jgi:hypothetical protein
MTDHLFPDLKIVPIDHIRLQEHVKKHRMSGLVSMLEKEQVLRSPPIVTPFFNSTYLHLDGANRITALDQLGYPNCLVHIVDYSDTAHVRLTSWSHLTNLPKEMLLAALATKKGIQVEVHPQFHHRLLLQPTFVAAAVYKDGSTLAIKQKASLVEQVQTMETMVELYEDRPVERVYSASPWTPESIARRFEQFPHMSVFFAFPTFSPQQVIKIVDKGVLMPAGLTRHVVYRRKININLPLSYLKEPVDIANEKLQTFLQGRSVRLYEEPIIYFE